MPPRRVIRNAAPPPPLPPAYGHLGDVMTMTVQHHRRHLCHRHLHDLYSTRGADDPRVTPVKTRTPVCRYGFSGVGVRVGPE
jgi:hypothetical protein